MTTEIKPTQTDRIRALNDELRQNLNAGTAVMTCGVAALGAEAVARIVKTIAVYDDFCHANDPHEEHDFGALRSRWPHDLFQNRLLRSHADRALRRSGRSSRHQARHHHHAGGGILSDTPVNRQCSNSASHSTPNTTFADFLAARDSQIIFSLKSWVVSFWRAEP